MPEGPGPLPPGGGSSYIPAATIQVAGHLLVRWTLADVNRDRDFYDVPKRPTVRCNAFRWDQTALSVEELLESPGAR